LCSNRATPSDRNSYRPVSCLFLGPDAGYTDEGFRFCTNSWQANIWIVVQNRLRLFPTKSYRFHHPLFHSPLYSWCSWVVVK
jgi:hypothetical protein